MPESRNSGNVSGTDGGAGFQGENNDTVVEDPRFVCEECGFANVALTTCNGFPAAKCTECGASYLETDDVWGFDDD